MGEHLAIRLLAATSYLGIFIVIPVVFSVNFFFINFHVKQGFILIVVWLLLLTSLLINENIGSYVVIPGTLVLSIFAIIGITNAIRGKAERLPFIGGLVDIIDN